jgi:uncharacterized membrane protein YfcA
VSPVEAVFLLITGIVAGVVGSAGGITSLVSYPALIAVGIPPLPANVANLVAAAATGPGAAVSSRRELAVAGSVLLRLLPVAAFGSAVGSVLLLITPAGMFARMVPFLVAGGSVVLLAQPVLLKLRERILVSAPLLTVLLVGAVSIYGGYFGAGSGVMLLAVVSVLVDPRIPPANAIKNMLIGATSLASATVFMINGGVQWNAVLPLAGGSADRQRIGPHRRPALATEPRTLARGRIRIPLRDLPLAPRLTSPLRSS